jgi:multiple sugar transport system substrate-binding protein
MLESLEGKGLTRRSILKAMGGGLAISLLAACQPKIVEVEKIVEKEVTKIVEVEKVVKETVIVGGTPKVVEKIVKETVVVQVEAAPEEATLEFWSTWSDDYFLVPMIEDFISRHPNLKVNLTLRPGGGDYNELLLTRIASGDPPDMAHTFQAPVVFGARGALVPIDDFMVTAAHAKPGSFWPLGIQTCQWRGKTYGLPFSMGNYVITYNVDWFEEKGIPADRESFPTKLDDLRALSAEFLEWEGDELKTFGFVPWDSPWYTPSWVESNGSPGFFVPEEEKYTISHPQNVEIFEYWVSWLDEQYKGNWEYLSQLAPFGPRGEAFKAKQVAMGVMGSWAIGNAGMAKGTIPYRWEVARFPVGPSGTQTKTAFWPNWFVTPKGSPHPYEGFLLCEYMTTIGHHVHMQYHYEGALGWKEFPRDIISAQIADWQGLERGLELHNMFIEYVEDGAAHMWTSPIEDFANDQIHRAHDQVIHKAQTAQEALDEAQKVTRAKLEEMLVA